MTTSPCVAVGGVILRGNEVLLIRRGHPPGEGSWSLPGGRVLFGEALHAAVIRELHEETSLHVSVGPLVEVIEIMLEGYHYVVLDYLCHMSPSGQNPVAADDATEATWVAVESLDSLTVTPDVLRVVQHAIAIEHETDRNTR